VLIALMMEAARTSETLVNFYQTIRRYNPEDSNLPLILFEVILWTSLALNVTCRMYLIMPEGTDGTHSIIDVDMCLIIIELFSFLTFHESYFVKEIYVEISRSENGSHLNSFPNKTLWIRHM
jgi:hypothetical protein